MAPPLQKAARVPKNSKREEPMSLRRYVLAVVASLLAIPAQAQVTGKKVLFVNSYHEGYPWSDGEEAGAKGVLSPAGVKLDFVRMDTKRHQDETFRKEAGDKAKAQIEAAKPDVVLLSDDPAVKYVLVPYFKDSSIPFVFMGVNWEAGKYGLPTKNVTGMVEVALVKNLVGSLKEYAKGPRVAFLTADSETEHIDGPYYAKALGLAFTEEKYVKTLADWKDAFVKMQDKCDVLFFGNNAGINDWNDKEAAAFAQANTKVVTGGIYDFLMPYVMLGYTKIAEEQGAWAGKAALDILKGTAPSAIPVAANKQAKIFINPRIAAKAGVVFKPELVKNAQVAAP
jgi:ABC-type uncharacterized transport system substrate-binding protein